MLNVRKLAQGVHTATRAGRVRLRPTCQLRSFEVVAKVLAFLYAGFSQAEAARMAGISEATVRLWLTEGAKSDDPANPYTAFRTAASAIKVLTHPKPAKPVSSPPVAVDASVPPSGPVAAVVPSTVAEMWQTKSRQAERLRTSPYEAERAIAERLTAEVQHEMQTYGVTEPPLPSARYLPPNLPRHDIHRLYVQWCLQTGQPTPNDYRVEREAMPWYRERVRLPDAETT